MTLSVEHISKVYGKRRVVNDVSIAVEPGEIGKGYTFINKIVGGAIPREYIPAVDKGIKESLRNGPLAGYPIEDIKVTLTFGSYHDVDSSEMAFKIAGSMAFKEATSGGCSISSVGNFVQYLFLSKI